MPVYYCCTVENNNCELKDTCERYVESDAHAPLYKVSCTNENEHILYIKKKEESVDGVNEDCAEQQ